MVFYKFRLLPPIETKSILTELTIFSWRKRATRGSSFFDLEKKERYQNLEAESGIRYKKNRLIPQAVLSIIYKSILFYLAYTLKLK